MDGTDRIIVSFTVAFFVQFSIQFSFHFSRKMRRETSSKTSRKLRIFEKRPRDPFFENFPILILFLVSIFSEHFELRFHNQRHVTNRYYPIFLTSHHHAHPLRCPTTLSTSTSNLAHHPTTVTPETQNPRECTRPIRRRHHRHRSPRQ